MDSQAAVGLLARAAAGCLAPLDSYREVLALVQVRQVATAAMVIRLVRVRVRFRLLVEAADLAAVGPLPRQVALVAQVAQDADLLL